MRKGIFIAFALALIALVFLSGCSAQQIVSTGCCPFTNSPMQCQYAMDTGKEEAKKSQPNQTIINWSDKRLTCADGSAYCIYCEGAGDTEPCYETPFAVCSARPTSACGLDSCTAMVCGRKVVDNKPQMTASDASKGKYDSSSMTSEKQKGLYKSLCEFRVFNSKTEKLLKRSRGKMYVNSFRFGIGRTYSDYEEARLYFPVTDSIVSTSPIAYKDRYMNYLILDENGTSTESVCIFEDGGSWNAGASNYSCTDPPDNSLAASDPSIPLKYRCTKDAPDNSCFFAKQICDKVCAGWRSDLCTTSGSHPSFLNDSGSYKMSTDIYHSFVHPGFMYPPVPPRYNYEERITALDGAFYASQLRTWYTNQFPQPLVTPSTLNQGHINPITNQWAPGAEFECDNSGECYSGNCNKNGAYKRSACEYYDGSSTTIGLELPCSCYYNNVMRSVCAIGGSTKIVYQIKIPTLGGYWYPSWWATYATPPITFYDAGGTNGDGITYETYTDDPAGALTGLVKSCNLASGTDYDYYPSWWCVANATENPAGSIPRQTYLTQSFPSAASGGTNSMLIGDTGCAVALYGRLVLHVRNDSSGSTYLGSCKIDDDRLVMRLHEHGWCEPATIATMAVQEITPFSIDGVTSYCPTAVTTSTGTNTICHVDTNRNPDEHTGSVASGSREISVALTCERCSVPPSPKKSFGYMPYGTPNYLPNAAMLSTKTKEYLKANIMPVFIVNQGFNPPDGSRTVSIGSHESSVTLPIYPGFLPDVAMGAGPITLVLPGESPTSRVYTKAKLYKQFCPNCIVSLQAQSLNPDDGYLARMMPGAPDAKNVDSIAFTLNLNTVTSGWPTSGCTGADRCCDGSDKFYGDMLKAATDYSRAIVQKYKKPTFIIQTYGKRSAGSTPCLDDAKIAGFYTYAFAHARDMTDAGIYGMVYSPWKEYVFPGMDSSSRALVPVWSFLNVERRGDKFCGLQNGATKLIGMKYSTGYIELTATENCSCEECSQFEIQMGMCSPYCEAGGTCYPASGQPVPTLPNGQMDPTATGYKCKSSCVNPSCALCNQSAGSIACLIEKPNETKTVGPMLVKTLDEKWTDILGSMPKESRCCLQHMIKDEDTGVLMPGSKYTYTTRRSAALNAEAAIYPTSGKEGTSECGKTPKGDTTACDIPTLVRDELTTCTMSACAGIGTPCDFNGTCCSNYCSPEGRQYCTGSRNCEDLDNVTCAQASGCYVSEDFMCEGTARACDDPELIHNETKCNQQRGCTMYAHWCSGTPTPCGDLVDSGSNPACSNQLDCSWNSHGETCKGTPEYQCQHFTTEPDCDAQQCFWKKESGCAT